MKAFCERKLLVMTILWALQSHIMSSVLVLHSQTRKMILIFAIFKFLKIFVIFWVFPASAARESPLRFDNRALYKFKYKWIGFQHFNVSDFSVFFWKRSAIFLRFYIVFVNFWYLSTLKCREIYSTVNSLSFRILKFSDKIFSFKFFQNICLLFSFSSLSSQITSHRVL